MKSNPVAWFEIYVQDIDRAKRFYESVFQVTLQKLDAPFPGVELRAFPADMSSYGASGARHSSPRKINQLSPPLW